MNERVDGVHGTSSKASKALKPAVRDQIRRLLGYPIRFSCTTLAYGRHYVSVLQQ